MKTLLTIIFVCALGGCSLLSKEECEKINWKGVGYRDGKEGSDFDEYASKQRSCKEYGVVPPKDIYMTGYKEGLKEYCTEESGRREGEEGDDYLKVCPPELETVFLRGYNLGYEHYKLEKRRKALEEQEEEFRKRQKKQAEEAEELRKKTLENHQKIHDEHMKRHEELHKKALDN